MKKLVSILCVTVLLVVSAFPVSAASDGNEKTMSGMELSIKRISGNFAKKTEEEIARDVLRELGMSENLIQGVNEEYLDMVYNAKSISANNQYGEVNSDGEVALLSDEEFAEEISTKSQNDSGVSTRSLEGEPYDEESDNLFNKSLYVIETKNAPQGTIALITSFEWIDEPFYRCWDVIAISGTNLEFNEESTLLTVVYTEQVENLSLANTSVTSVVKEYDYTDLSVEDNIFFSGSYVGAKYDVPLDARVPGMFVMCNDIGVMMMVSTEITNPQLITNFTVTGWYFHQEIGIEWDVSLSGDALSLNISPSLFYDDPHQIQLTPRYVP